MFLCENHCKLWTVSVLTLKQIFWKMQTFFKKLEYHFLVESTKIENAIFVDTKLPFQKPILRQIEWWVQNGTITENGDLPVTTLFFWRFCFSVRTFYKELIWCTNYPNVHVDTFRKSWSFIWECFFPVNIHKTKILHWGFRTKLAQNEVLECYDKPMHWTLSIFSKKFGQNMFLQNCCFVIYLLVYFICLYIYLFIFEKKVIWDFDWNHLN